MLTEPGHRSHIEDRRGPTSWEPVLLDFWEKAKNSGAEMGNAMMSFNSRYKTRFTEQDIGRAVAHQALLKRQQIEAARKAATPQSEPWWQHLWPWG